MDMPEGNIRSIPDAILTARRLGKNEHHVRLDPCDKPTKEGKPCPFKDLSLKILCKHPDGLLSEKGTVFCPKQEGDLRIVSKS